MEQYVQEEAVLWKASIVVQDEMGNELERSYKVFARTIQEALTNAYELIQPIAIDEEWYRWIIYDIGIMPDNCFN